MIHRSIRSVIESCHAAGHGSGFVKPWNRPAKRSRIITRKSIDSLSLRNMMVHPIFRGGHENLLPEKHLLLNNDLLYGLAVCRGAGRDGANSRQDSWRGNRSCVHPWDRVGARRFEYSVANG